MGSTQTLYRAKRVYEITRAPERVFLRLSDRVVELGERESAWYEKVADWLPTSRGLADLSRQLELDEAKVPKFIEASPALASSTSSATCRPR